MQNVGSIVRAHPSTLLLPLLVFCICCAVGCWAVVFTNGQDESKAEDLAQVGPCMMVDALKRR